mgnify:CR=1 FL=1
MGSLPWFMYSRGACVNNVCYYNVQKISTQYQTIDPLSSEKEMNLCKNVVYLETSIHVLSKILQQTNLFSFLCTTNINSELDVMTTIVI